MKALVYEGNHTLTVKETDIPQIDRGEVLIRVHFVGICGTDMLIWHDGLARVKPPVIIGHEFSGVIEKVGSPDSPYKPGDRVVVEPLLSCGVCKACKTGAYNVCQKFRLLGIDADGAMADYVKAPEHKLFRIPGGMSFEDAAFVEPLAVGVHMVRRSGLGSGQVALVAGGGPIGLIAASVAQLKSATVYVSEVNPFRIGMAKELGFRTVNPKEENVAERINADTGRGGADAAFEATGTQAGLADCIAACGPRGAVVIAGLPKSKPVVDVYEIVAKELNVVGSRVYRSEDYEDALELIKSGQFSPRKFISRIITLDEAVEQGFKPIDRGDPVMKILIRIKDGE